MWIKDSDGQWFKWWNHDYYDFENLNNTKYGRINIVVRCWGRKKILLSWLDTM